MARIQRELTTRWTEDQVKDLVENQRLPHYQQISLPYGLQTKGADRTKTSEIIFPDELTGKSVLDIGCQIGHFCHDACHLGAARVLGMDINPGALDEARKISDCLGHPSEFRQFDIERENIDEKFDIVLCLNVIQHFKNPLLVLEKLIEACREQIILELPAFGPRDCKRMRLSRYLGKLLDRLPVMYAGETGINGKFYSPKFGITASALRNIFLHHRTTFARVRSVPSEFKQRYIAFADKRRFDRMIILAGMPASGKSTLMDKLMAGDEAQIAGQLSLGDAAAWTAINAKALHTISEPHLEKLMMHYTVNHPQLKWCRTFERDELLDPVLLTDKLTVLTLWADPEVLLRRFNDDKVAPYMRDGEYTGSPSVLERRAHLKDRQLLMTIYNDWLDYVQRLGAESIIVDNTDGVEFLTREQWQERSSSVEVAG